MYGLLQLHRFLLWCQYKNEKNFSIYLLISRWSLNKTTKSSSNKTNNKEACLKIVDQLLSLNTYQYSFKDFICFRQLADDKRIFQIFKGVHKRLKNSKFSKHPCCPPQQSSSGWKLWQALLCLVCGNAGTLCSNERKTPHSWQASWTLFHNSRGWSCQPVIIKWIWVEIFEKTVTSFHTIVRPNKHKTVHENVDLNQTRNLIKLWRHCFHHSIKYLCKSNTKLHLQKKHNSSLNVKA